MLASYVKVTHCQEGLGVHFTAFEQMIINNSNCVHFLLRFFCVSVCACVCFSLHKLYAHVLPYFSETIAKRKK